MKIGLVLSGGGARGFVHLGVLKAMNELHIAPNLISGSSAGALIGALYAAGYSPEYIYDLILQKGIKGNLRFALNRFGLFSMTKIEKLLTEYIPHNSFEQLKVKLTVCATDIKRGEPKYFNSGELNKVVLASCSIPGVFAPIIIDGKTYIDGGVTNNLPLEPIEEESDFLIGVNVMPPEKNMPISSAKDILVKCLLLSVGQQALAKVDKFDIMIQPKGISHFDGLSLSKSQQLFDIGYKTAKEQLLLGIEKLN
jgi:NTE family protein